MNSLLDKEKIINNMRKKILVKFGQRMKVLRVQKTKNFGSKFSQEKLGEISGLHRNYISDAERGTRNVSLVALLKIVKGLDCTLAEFFAEGFEEA